MIQNSRFLSGILACLGVGFCLLSGVTLLQAAPASRPVSRKALQDITGKAPTSRPSTRPVVAKVTTKPATPPAPGSLKTGLKLLFHGESKNAEVTKKNVLFKGATLVDGGAQGKWMATHGKRTFLQFRSSMALKNITVGMWVRVSRHKHDTGLLSFLDDVGNWSVLLNLSPDGYPVLAAFHGKLSNSKETVSKQPLPAKAVWSHIAFVLDFQKKESRLYLNGTSVGVLKYLPEGNPLFLNVGGNKHKQAPQAQFDDISVHSRVLSDREIKRLAHPSRVLRSLPNHWPKARVPGQNEETAPTQKELLLPAKGLKPYTARKLHKKLAFLLHCSASEWPYLFTDFIFPRVTRTPKGWRGEGCQFNGRSSYLRTDNQFALENITLQFWFRVKRRKGGLFSVQHITQTSMGKGKKPRLVWGWQAGVLDNGQVEVSAFHHKTSRTLSFSSKEKVFPGLWYHFMLTVGKSGKKQPGLVKLYLNGRLQKSVRWPVILHTGWIYFGGAPHFGFLQGQMDEMGLFTSAVPARDSLWYATARSPLYKQVDPTAEGRKNLAEEQRLSPAELKAYKKAAIRTFSRGLMLMKKAQKTSSASLWQISNEMLKTSTRMLVVLVRRGEKLPGGLDFPRPIDLPPAPLVRVKPTVRKTPAKRSKAPQTRP